MRRASLIRFISFPKRPKPKSYLLQELDADCRLEWRYDPGCDALASCGKALSFLGMDDTATQQSPAFSLGYCAFGFRSAEVLLSLERQDILILGFGSVR